MFCILLKIGFAFIALENVVSLHSPKDCGEAKQLWYFLRKYKAQPARI